MSDNLPADLESLCDYIVEHAGSIAVREQIDGKWGVYFLTELSPVLAIKHALRFVKEGRIPIRMKEEV